MGLDVFGIERGAGRDGVGVEALRHVEQHAAGDDGRDFVGAELGEPFWRDEIGWGEAVVVLVVDAHVAEAVELAADAHPGVEQVVVAGGEVCTHRRAAVLPRLDDGDGVVARRIGRSFPAGDDAERVGLAGLHQPGGTDHAFWGEMVDRSQGVVCAMLRRIPVVSGGGEGNECTCEGGSATDSEFHWTFL